MPRGRPKLLNKLVFKSVGLTLDQWIYLKKWCPEGNQTAQLRALIKMVEKKYPQGRGLPE
jgi:hypothetical protein